MLHFILGLFLLPQTLHTPADTILPVQPDSTGKVVIHDIVIFGNRVTKRYIILRELNFNEGDTLTYAALKLKMKKASENLLNTSLFNFASVDTVHVPFNQESSPVSTRIVINVTERWYTFPVPIFEVADRNFNTWWETKDLTRINYGFFLNRENFRGRKETVALIAQFGYSEQYGFAYRIPYLNKKQTEGIGFSFTWTRNHEIPYGSQYNKVLYFKDHDAHARREISAKFNYTYRQGIYNSYTLEGRFFNGFVEDTITKLTTDYFDNNRKLMECFSLDAFLRRDCRDSKAYPLKGYYLDADITKVGLGILEDEKIDLWYLSASVKKYLKLSDRFYLAGSARGKVSSKTTQPYYYQRGLGYRDYIRAYEYYVVDGQHYVLGKAGVKYEIIKPHVQKVKMLRSEKFNTFHYALYAEVFGDGGYVVDDLYKTENNPLANQWLYAGGIGINYVTYYDAVLRLEVSINKQKEYGFFIHLGAPI